MALNHSYNRYLEEIAEETAEQLEETMQLIEEALMPDGRPLFTEKVSDEARLRDYILRRGNPMAQLDYIRSLVSKAATAMAEVGVNPAATHTFDAAYNYVVIESAELERKLLDYPDILMEWAQMQMAPPMMDPMMMQPPPPMLG